jgi:hypothetical protein
MKSNTYRLLSILAVSWVPVHAGTISYSDSGTFAASTSSSAFSGPGETWSFSFQVDTNPIPVEFGNGGFDLPFTNFSYTLNGSPVAITPTAIRFFTGFNGGGFFVCFIEACGNGNFPSGLGTGFDWPQMYTGPNSAPTLTSGAFTGDFGVALEPHGSSEPNTTIVGLLDLQGGTTSTPVYLVGTSVGGIGGTISGQGAEDYYVFNWGGGPFSATVSISGAPSGASYLYSAGVAGTCSSRASQTLNSGDGFTATISSGNLAPGEYCIGLDANNPNDPNFSLIFNTPVSGVAEPSTFLLLSAGIGLISARRLAKRRMP